MWQPRLSCGRRIESDFDTAKDVLGLERHHARSCINGVSDQPAGSQPSPPPSRSTTASGAPAPRWPATPPDPAARLIQGCNPSELRCCRPVAGPGDADARTATASPPMAPRRHPPRGRGVNEPRSQGQHGTNPTPAPRADVAPPLRAGSGDGRLRRMRRPFVASEVPSVYQGYGRACLFETGYWSVASVEGGPSLRRRLWRPPRGAGTESGGCDVVQLAAVVGCDGGGSVGGRPGRVGDGRAGWVDGAGCSAGAVAGVREHRRRPSRRPRGDAGR